MSIDIKDVEAKVLEMATVLTENYAEIAKTIFSHEGERSIEGIGCIIDEFKKAIKEENGKCYTKH